MQENLKGKKAIVTGGTAGIGRAIALEFAKRGAKVALFGTSPERGQQVVEEIGADNARFYPVDVSSTEAVEKAVAAAQQDLNGIDILVNNAGITKDQLLMKMSEEDWDSVLNTNLKSAFNLCRALVRPFLKAKRGKIINISSVIGLTGNAGQANYAASKSGMIGLTKALAKELAARNIQVNCIAPGFIDTNMTKSLSENHKTALLAQIPLGRLGMPEDVAKAALFLASGDSDYITGQVLTVDGGMVM